MAFDTLTYAKKLQEAGFTSQQAEAQAEALRGIVDENLATKHDLKETESALRRDMKEMETGLRHDMKEMEAGLRHDMKEMETGLRHDMQMIRSDMQMMRRDIIIWLGGLIIVATTALGLFMKLL